MAPLPRKVLARRLILALRIASFLPVVWPLYGAFARSALGRDELCGAAYNGCTWEIRLLLAAGADPNRVGWEEHFTPLAEALWNGQIEAARLLLAVGADPNAPNDPNFGNTVLGAKFGSTGDPVSQARVAKLIRQAGGHL